MEPRTLAGRYQLTRRIGSGGMGTVWQAHDLALGREVAVKLLHEGMAADASFAERFRREARNAARLAHPNVVAVYDSGEDDGAPFIVMELVDGESLHAVLQREGALPVRRAVGICHAVLAALSHAHARGLVHRDMKPGNVLLTPDGEVKVADFGIAKGLRDDGDLTRTGSLMGTAAYLSPEQVEGRDATPASDVYAVGCLLFACLAGTAPFEGETPVAIAMMHLRNPVPRIRARRPDVPADVEAVIVRALEKDPARRLRSANEMAVQLEATGLETLPADDATLLMAAPTAAVRTHTEVLTRTSAPPSRAGPVIGTLAALLLAGAIAWLAFNALGDQESPSLDARLPDPTLTPLPTRTTAPTTAPPTAAPTPSASVLELPGGVQIGIPEEVETPEPEDTPDPDDEPTEEPAPNISDTGPPVEPPADALGPPPGANA